MVSLGILHKIRSRRFYPRAIALVQVMVMLMLAVPACCYEIEPGHEQSSISQSDNKQDDHDRCPCCPDENKADPENGSCSTCSYCTYYAPLTPLISTRYNPFVAPLLFSEKFTKLSEVHLPIFSPPQNLA